jgi:hypothetical protein
LHKCTNPIVSNFAISCLQQKPLKPLVEKNEEQSIVATTTNNASKGEVNGSFSFP